MTPRVAMMTDTGRLRIGIAHTQRAIYTPSADEVLIQRAVLDKRTAQPVGLLQRVVAVLWRWL